MYMEDLTTLLETTDKINTTILIKGMSNEVLMVALEII